MTVITLKIQRWLACVALVMMTALLAACSEDPVAQPGIESEETPAGKDVFSVTGAMLELCEDYGVGDADEDRVRDLGCELLVSVGFDNARISTGLDPQVMCSPVKNVDVQTVEIESIESATQFALTWLDAEPARAQTLTVEMLQLVFLKNNPFCPTDLAGSSPMPIEDLMKNVSVTADDFMAYCAGYGQPTTVSEQIRDYACTLYVTGMADYLSENANDVPGGYCLDNAKGVDYLMPAVLDYMKANRARLKNYDSLTTVMTAVRKQAPCDVVVTD